MAIKIFLDTNIILDLLDTERLFTNEAFLLLEKIENGDFVAYFSESVITTIDYVLTKKFTKEKRLQILKDLLQLLTIVECTNSIVENALQNANGDAEDLILYELAISESIDYFITNDKKAQKALSTKKLPVIGSKAFLKIIQ
jgi:predicted nucleic acid-binding protein